MNYLISLSLLLPCVAGAAGRLVQQPRGAYAVYADSSGEEYEPYAVVPLHAPLPFLQVLSPAPAPTKRRRRPAKRPRPALDTADVYAFDASHVEQAYEPAGYSELYSAELEPQPAKYSNSRDQYDDEASSVVVYARPNRHGSFSYRRPASHAAPATPAPRPRDPQEPVIIRIHKYRVIH